MTRKSMGVLREYTYQLQLFTEMTDSDLQRAFIRTSQIGMRFGFRLGGILGCLVGGAVVGVGMALMR